MLSTTVDEVRRNKGGLLPLRGPSCDLVGSVVLVDVTWSSGYPLVWTSIESERAFRFRLRTI